MKFNEDYPLQITFIVNGGVNMLQLKFLGIIIQVHGGIL